MSLHFKPGTSLEGLNSAGARILQAGARASKRVGKDFTVSSGTDGDRLPTDPHKTGEAIDFSVANLTEDEIMLAYQAMKADLPLDQFTVLFEVKVLPTSAKLRAIAYVNSGATGQHFHVQRKKGTVYV